MFGHRSQITLQNLVQILMEYNYRNHEVLNLYILYAQSSPFY